MTEQAQARTPMRRDAERNRQRILDAASAAFQEVGLHASHEEIARRAEVSLATVYRRFPSRDDLLEALLDRRLGELTQIADEALVQEDAWAGLVQFLERSLELMAEDVGLREAMHTSPRRAALAEHAHDTMAPLAQALAERAVASGALRPEIQPHDLFPVRVMLVAVLDAVSDQRPGMWRRYLALLLDGLRAGDRPRVPLPPGPSPEEAAQILRHPPPSPRRG